MDTKGTTEQEFQKDNHYVPRLYLKQWTDAQQKIQVYRVLVPHENVPIWRPSSIKGIGYHEHLYTRVVAVGETDQFEKWIARNFEGPAEGPIERAISGSRLSVDDWRCLIRFVAAQDVRTPARLQETMRRWERTLPDIVQGTLNNVVKELTEAKRLGRPIRHNPNPAAADFPARVTTEIEPGAAEGRLKVEAISGRALWLFGLKNLLTKTIDTLILNKWFIVRAPIGMQWVTSDDPVIKLNFHGPSNYDFKGGWGSPGTEIFMPLGPEHLIYTKVGERLPPVHTRRLSQEVAEIFQRFTIQHAHRVIFATHNDPFVSATRPRAVDPVAYEHERRQWTKWNDEQGEAERGLYHP
jgi:Protein of unknown function (DUF4238)